MVFLARLIMKLWDHMGICGSLKQPSWFTLVIQGASSHKATFQLQQVQDVAITTPLELVKHGKNM